MPFIALGVITTRMSAPGLEAKATIAYSPAPWTQGVHQVGGRPSLRLGHKPERLHDGFRHCHFSSADGQWQRGKCTSPISNAPVPRVATAYHPWHHLVANKNRVGGWVLKI